jgi:capsular exopolysaccharide synthesis family protein
MNQRKPAVGAGSAQSGMTAKDIMGMIRRHIWLIVISLMVFTGASGAGTFAWRTYKPYYEAMALIAVQPPKGTVLEARAWNPQTNENYMERQMASAAQSIRSEEVFEQVTRNNEVRGTQYYQERVEADSANDVLVELSNDVSVRPMPGTNFLRIAMRGTNRDEITTIVNAVSKAAIDDTDDTKTQELLATITQLENERKDLQRTITDNMQLIERLNERSIMGNRLEPLPVLQSKANVLIVNRMEVTNEYLAARQQLEMMDNYTPEQLADMYEVQWKLERDRQYQMLLGQALQLEQEQVHVEQKFGENHPTYRNIAGRLEHVQTKLERKRQELTEQAIQEIREMREGMVAGLEQQYTQIEGQLETIKTQISTWQQLEKDIEEAKGKVEKAEETLQNLETRLLDLRLVMGRERPLVLHRSARSPNSIAFPTYTVMVPLGVFLGLLFGFGLTFLLELTDTSIKAPSDVARKVELPMLGMIPHLDDVEEDIPDLRLAFMTNPDTIVSEAFRQIRTTLMFSGPVEQRRSMLVTSPMPEDGRTSVSLNLGHAIAHGGRSVLVIDANFRQPVIRKLFPMCPDGGLSSCLSDATDWRELTHEVEPNLHVMAAGPIPPNPAELLGSDKMRQLLTEFQGEFDQIIFDGAPCLVVSDSAVLSTVVDGVVLTVRASVSTYGIVQRTRDMLNKLGSHIFGVVLNGVRVTAGGYLRKNYETFYEYRESSHQLASAPVAAPSHEPDEELADLADFSDESEANEDDDLG